jgi:hypothetical protein
VLKKAKPAVTIADVIQWQVDNHEGFIRSFISSARYSSIEDRQETWTKLSTRNDKVLIIAGSTDPVIISKELRVDAEATIGRDHLDFREIVGGHDFAITDPDKVVDIVSAFWKL